MNRRIGESYSITSEEIAKYKQEGYLVLHNLLSEKELEWIDPWFEHFITGEEMERMGKDFCDMSQPYGTPLTEFRLVNAMLPSLYRKELANNIYHRVAQSIANQLYQGGVARMDYEQFLAKKPAKPGAEFSMHQDLGYWPKTKNTWTATFSLALSDSNENNGCLQVIPGSNNEQTLRKHIPKTHSGPQSDSLKRNDSHTLEIESNPDDIPTLLPVKRGSVTIHDERIVHGSGGNHSNEWRKTYVMAFRDIETIQEVRSMGFTHSHNDKIDWSTIL